ncbi:MAG: response regulator [Anaerolineae bacterium]
MTEEVDDLDLAIIGLLQEDGRVPNVEVARALGVAESTVRKRLDRLLQNGVLRVVAVPNLPKVGLPVEVLVWLQVSPAGVKEVASRLRNLPEVRTLRFTTGEYQLTLEACFPSQEALHAFLNERLSTLPGTVRMSTAQVLHTEKRSEEWRLPRRTRPLVLVVDDDPDFVETTRWVLEREGHQVDSAADGREALERMRRRTPDVVVLDVMMRGVLDGVSVSEAMQRDEKLMEVPVVMVSSIPDSPYAEMFPTDRSLHMDAFLTKPVSPERLAGEVQKLLALVGRRSAPGSGAGSPRTETAPR